MTTTEQFSRLPNTPANRRNIWEDLCGACEHRYGDHYRTYDQDNFGCSMVDGHLPCACQGYEEKE